MTMVTKYVILPLIFACYFLAGCGVSSNEKTVSSSETETVTDQDDLKIDISKIEQIYIDEYKTQNDNLKCVGKISMKDATVIFQRVK
ncbi:MAG: hypothetical protein IKP31_06075 [Lachnospiraceae bacterium]|nr:hypothetical protein [Lachnospiraceae bacterium]